MSDGKDFYIGGEWVGAVSGDTYPVKNPANGETLAEVSRGGTADAIEAIGAAHGAFPGWSAMAAAQRAAILLRIRDLILERKEELGRIITDEEGKPLEEGIGEASYAASFLTVSAEECKRQAGEAIPSTSAKKRLWVIRQPVGVVGAITPWNFPAAMITRKVAPALATGCTVVVKPAEETPLSAIALFRIFEEAGLPPGVANLVFGDAPAIGQALLRDRRVRKIAFTGSTEVGKYLMRESADTVKRVTLELGGHAPFIVFDDADLDAALDGLLAGKFRNAGQTCICPNRVYIHDDVFEEFAGMLADAVKALRVGQGLADGVDIGPLINAEGLAKVKEHVEEALGNGARALCGGGVAAEGGDVGAGGHYFEPTLLVDVPPDCKILHEETFGPVLPLERFTDESDVVARANDTPYGLAAYFFTRDLARSIRVSEALEYGIVGVNDARPAVAEAPFGGYKESGIGREGGRYGLDEFVETKLVSIAL